MKELPPLILYLNNLLICKLLYNVTWDYLYDMLTPQIFEAINFLKSNREFWENSQQLISRAISMSKMENFRAYKRMEEDETEEKRMNGDNN